MKTASRTVHLEDVGDVVLERSRRARRLVLTVRTPRNIRVAVPAGLSFDEAERFAREKLPWLRKTLDRIRRQAQKHAEMTASFASLDRPSAKKALTRRLRELAVTHGFQVGRVSIREQKTRWGSCSTHNDISLNIKLALLPGDLLDYVLLHELVHTRVHNHGAGFWRELDRYVGDARSLARRLRDYDLRLI